MSIQEQDVGLSAGVFLDEHPDSLREDIGGFSGGVLPDDHPDSIQLRGYCWIFRWRPPR